jgi:hypothetical protein
MIFFTLLRHLFIILSLSTLAACMMTQEQDEPVYTKQQVQPELATDNNQAAGVQLGLYLSVNKVSHQVLKLKHDYPNALQGLSFRFKPRDQKGVTLYALRAGPFKNYSQASAFCEIAKKMGQSCVTATFVGEML